MACVSDIDLATLHKRRLEERINYKLAWGTEKRNLNYFNYHHHQNAHQTRQNGLNEIAMKCLQHNNKKYIVHGRGKSKTTAASTNDSQDGFHLQRENQPQYNQHSSRKDGKKTNGCDILNGNLDKLSLGNNVDEKNGNVAGNSLTDNGNGNINVHEEDTEFYFSGMKTRSRSGTWPRTRSLNAPSPFQQFGPCGRIMKNSAMVMQIQDPASQRLTWYKPPLTVLVIKKVRDSTVLSPFVQLVEWLVQEKNMVVWVEAAVLDDPLLVEDKRFQQIKDKLVTFKDGRDDLTDRIDFIVCLGGDGTLLYASLLFQQSVPPVMAFHLGSLGFLTPFQFDNFQDQVTNVLEGHAALTLRSRLRCIIVRKGERYKEALTDNETSSDRTETAASNHLFSDNQQTPNMRASTNILVLNEVVIDRGPSPYLSNIDLFLDGKHITSVQGDGLIVSTPTGSTAYAVAAGASMIHPSVPAIMVTPICPHSLSFRPIVVPAGVELKISISPDSRNTSWVSFDGRNRQELFHGDSLRVTTSIYPVPSICAQDQISDWFDSLAECLHWNVRKRQKCLDELSDLTGSGSEDTLDDLDRANDSLLDS
ncbi:unnamed protein product [Hermetia illucens]|uniref:NAD(+) kinase n=2 Tax=Hermetia illucens TaxID=343691 RepID=A0A7R8UZU8_HERIL|nr:NAD kinase-like isoform X1 [Hermetia illucens]XP_037914573.1 NAD kinase-like isoform X1 [Hermetia illucens]CAD7089624.1 unnamed protein product [Hermetia illucens]